MWKLIFFPFILKAVWSISFILPSFHDMLLKINGKLITCICIFAIFSIQDYLHEVGFFSFVRTNFWRKMPLVKYFGASKLVKRSTVMFATEEIQIILCWVWFCFVWHMCVCVCVCLRATKHHMQAGKKKKKKLHVVYCGKTIFGLIENYLVYSFMGLKHVAIISTTRKFTWGKHAPFQGIT